MTFLKVLVQFFNEIIKKKAQKRILLYTLYTILMIAYHYNIMFLEM